jgi:hypothetical protein
VTLYQLGEGLKSVDFTGAKSLSWKHAIGFALIAGGPSSSGG